MMFVKTILLLTLGLWLYSTATAQKAVIQYKTTGNIRFSQSDDLLMKDNIVLTQSGSQASSHPLLRPEFYEEAGSHFPLLLFPGDSLFVSGSVGQLRIRSNNPQRQNELDCTDRLFKAYGSFIFDNFDAPDRIPFPDEMRRKNYEASDKKYFATFGQHLPPVPANNDMRDSLLYDFYIKRSVILDSFYQHQLISQPFRQTLKNHFFYRYLYHSVRGFEYTGEPLNKRLQQFIQPAVFNDSLLAGLNSYRAFLWFYNQYLTTIRLKRKSSGLEKMKNADSSFTGRSRDRILFAIASDNLDQRLRNDTLLTYFLKKCHTEEYLQAINNRISVSDISQTETSVLFDLQQQQIQLKDLLDKHKGRYIYIDLWASWCQPCLNEMEFSEKLNSRYKGKNITFLYFSLDTEAGSWKNMNRSFTAFMQADNSYLLGGNFASGFAKTYRVTSIPRYLLLGPDGKILSANAPRPGDKALIAQLDKLLK